MGVPGRLGAAAALTSAAIAFGSAASAATIDSPGCVLAKTPSIGISEVSRKRTADARVVDLTLHSQAMAGNQHVDVMLPAGYDASGRTRYPVLYLLHGAFGNYSDWVTHGVEGIVGKLPVIVVMPDDGPDGSYSDWYGTLAGQTGPAPAWESYHTRELIPFIDAHFPTIAAPAGRFVAGLSSGGGGAMKYAAANPGLFGAAGSFSGAVDTDLDYPDYPTVSEGLWLATLIPPLGPDGHCTWGDPYTQHVVWLAHDPTYLAENLKGTALWLASGNGSAGPYDSPADAFDPTEWTVWQMNQAFVKALDAAGVAHTDEFYGPGSHNWPYWLRDFRHFLAWLEPRIGTVGTAPVSFSYRSGRPAFSAWGWQFSVQRDVREFVYLTRVSSAGFTAAGSGRLTVTTPPVYRPGRRYSVTTGTSTITATADASAKLRFAVSLGPSHEVQQYQPGSSDPNSWTHVTVVIRPG